MCGRAAGVGPPLWRSGPLIWATKGRGAAAPGFLPAAPPGPGRGRVRVGDGKEGGGSQEGVGGSLGRG